MTAHDGNAHPFILHGDGFAWAVIEGRNIALPGRYRQTSLGWSNSVTGHIIALDN